MVVVWAFIVAKADHRPREKKKFYHHFSNVKYSYLPKDTFRGGAAKFGLISITYHKYIIGVYKYILRLEISIFDRKNR